MPILSLSRDNRLRDQTSIYSDFAWKRDDLILHCGRAGPEGDRHIARCKFFSLFNLIGASY